MIFDRLLGRGGRPLRVGYGRIFHEANAHSPILTTKDDFLRLHALEGEALHHAASLRGTELASFMPHAELTGFREAARLVGGVEAVPLSSHLAVPNGPLARECFDWLLSRLLANLERAGALDGVYLALHGSMDVAGLDEPPEAVILREVRARLPAGAKLAASFDLHANLAAEVVDALDVLVAYRTNPHWDLAPTGFRAGTRLVRALRGQLRPVHAWRKLPMVLGGGMTIDFLAPMRGVFRHLRRVERRPGIASTALFMVHPYTSAENLGWAVHVTTDGDRDLAERTADELAERVWAERDVELPRFRTIPEALDEVRDGLWRRLGPVSLVDVDDVVGAGAPGGNTRFVAELARDDRGLVSLVPLHDPDAVDRAWGRPIGSELQLTLRGTPGYGSPPVEVVGTIAARSEGEFGRRVRLDVGGLKIALSERPPLPIHPKFWRELDIDPGEADLMVQKNFFHYRMFHLTTSFRHLPVVSDGATSLARVRSRRYAVPVSPAAPLTDWRIHEPTLRRAPRIGASAAPEAPRPGAAP